MIKKLALILLGIIALSLALLIGFTMMVLALLFRLRAYFRGRFDDDG